MDRYLEPIARFRIRCRYSDLKAPTTPITISTPIMPRIIAVELFLRMPLLPPPPPLPGGPTEPGVGIFRWGVAASGAEGAGARAAGGVGFRAAEGAGRVAARVVAGVAEGAGARGAAAVVAGAARESGAEAVLDVVAEVAEGEGSGVAARASCTAA